MHHGTATGFETLTKALISQFAGSANRPEPPLWLDDPGRLSEACSDGRAKLLGLRLATAPSSALTETWLSQLQLTPPPGTQLLLDLPSPTAQTLLAALGNAPAEAAPGTCLPWVLVRQAGFLDLSDSGFARQISQSSPTTPEHWLRVLSWVASDQRLHTLVSLLEVALFAQTAAPICNRRWLLLGPRTPGMGAFPDETPRPLVEAGADLGQCVDADTRAAINAQMDSMRCRVLWYRLSALLATTHKLALDVLLDGEHLAVLERWRQLEQQDSDNVAITRSWHATADIAPLLSYKGIDLGATREYDLFSLLLTQHYRKQADGEP